MVVLSRLHSEEGTRAWQTDIHLLEGMEAECLAVVSCALAQQHLRWCRNSGTVSTRVVWW